MQDIYHSISHFGRILGSLFYYAPQDEQNQWLITFFQQENWQTDVGFLAPQRIARIQSAFIRSTADVKQLTAQYQQLFVGANKLPAPPWGSAYLDKEATSVASSLLDMRDFLQKNRIELSLPCNQPEDHFGLMLMLLAFLAENQPHLLAEYLTQHLLPWSHRFLTLLAEQQTSDFYAGLALLADALLDYWRQAMGLQVKAMPLYR
ncbi:Tat proofreading chaperone DmsD [Necropsobacter massiliensis]|uniref:Tat proofreading chaperone DmsD n=1 Tax=Necropsobacter massiliensis TaxID=1400001 RepID=UPI0005959016|nr:Tat proofreading chaperone DmsD [Necropsobacter massiliensis]